MAPPSRKSSPKKLRNPSSKAAISKGNLRSRTVSSQKLPLQLEDDAPDFPRGGGRSFRKKEKDEIGSILDNEIEADHRSLEKRKKGKKVQKRNQSGDDDLGSLFGDGIKGKLPRFSNRITLKNVSPGMKLWGVIAEVNEKDIVVSLPGGLWGLVRACEAFDPILGGEVEQDAENNFLSSIYSGQLVSCIVMQVHDDKKEIANRKIWLSLHLSLLHKGLTLDIIQEGMGYVCNIIESGCFVRFIGRLTGFAPKSKATDQWRTDLSEVFFVGQSVRSNIVDVCSETGRITLSLKQSLCCSTDSSFILEYFLLEEKIAKLQLLDSEGPS